MNELVPNLIEALREELTSYGEMLALLDHQQEIVMLRRTHDLLGSVASINAQSQIINTIRREREERQRKIARRLGLIDNAPLTQILPRLPEDYRPLVQALVQENNQLLVRVQQRARQNHLLLTRVVELMQRFINSLFPGLNPSTYNDAGRLLALGAPQQSLYNAVG